MASFTSENAAKISENASSLKKMKLFGKKSEKMDKHRFADTVTLEEDFCHISHEHIGLILRVQWPFVYPEGL